MDSATAKRLPGRGESVVGQGFTISPGGKAGNQACQLVKCGTDAFILTRLGDDAFGRQLFEHLTSRGVDPSLITVDASQPTGASTVFVAEGDYSSIIVSGAAGSDCADMISCAAMEGLTPSSCNWNCLWRFHSAAASRRPRALCRTQCSPAPDGC